MSVIQRILTQQKIENHKRNLDIMRRLGRRYIDEVERLFIESLGEVKMDKCPSCGYEALILKRGMRLENINSSDQYRVCVVGYDYRYNKDIFGIMNVSNYGIYGGSGTLDSLAQNFSKYFRHYSDK